MILGTAGHVDHGKTALVRALTGVDTDRLPDEKRRGITIDIGFAPLRLDGLPPIGVVDVPGHEAFVRNMLAGATGVDLALLVIAADEGVMPQTREHLLILTLLGVSAGVVALSKADLVDAEWMALVRDDVATLTRGTPLADAPVIATSVTTGEGLDELRAAIGAMVRDRPRRDHADLFRMPVDRSFTVRGTGTVVTGTVWSGALERDAVVRLLPGDRTARVRGLQSHGSMIERAEPGTRVAVALAGVEVADVHRGAVLITDPAWRPSARLLADAALAPDSAVALGPRTRVRLHLGTADVGARLIAPGGALSSGSRAVARVVLDEPVVARAGDRFVLRALSPVRTIGGGIVIDPLPVHRRQRAIELSPVPAERLVTLAERAGLGGVALAELPVRLGVPPAAVAEVVRAAGSAIETVGPRVFAARVLRTARDGARAIVDAYHKAHPLEPGMPAQELRERLGADPGIAEAILRDAVHAGLITVTGAFVSRAGWTPSLATRDADYSRQLLERLRAAGREPPTVAELAGEQRAHAFSILKFLERDGRVTQVEADRFYEAGALAGMVAALREGMRSGREFAPQEIREILGTSRKFLIPFLEYCDRTGVTERRANGRVLAEALQRADGGKLA